MSRTYVPALSTSITVKAKHLNFKNDSGKVLDLVLQADGKLQINLNGEGVRMAAPETQLIRDLLK